MYAELNKDKIEILERYGPTRNPKHTSFSVNSSHEDYAAHGYYKIIDNKPALPKTKKFGDRTFVVDEAAMTVDISREVVDKSDKDKRADKKAGQRASKLAGVDLGGTLCSATRDDQNGLAAISVGVIMARQSGETFPDTLFEFNNGAELLITDSNFNGYYAAWTAFRQGFFAP